MDNLTPSQRSYCMSRVKNRDTNLESLVRSELFKKGWRFRKHVSSLPGRPDIVFVRLGVAVFIDGDFWHGYRFPSWKENLSEFWITKIQKNRKRDRNNFAKLRRLGWQVVRVWQHEIEGDLNRSVERLEKLLATENDRRFPSTKKG
jgi:DNA mismatch endonuclease (patch repair protein)